MPLPLPLRELVLIATVLATTPLHAAESLSLMFGVPDAEHATFTFSPDESSPDAIVVETRLVGAAGSRLSLSIDKASGTIVDRILTQQDCRFVNQESTCRFSIPGDTPQYAAIVAAFKAGLTAHVTVETAGSMEMSQNISLQGFTRAFEGLR
jgi:hypothetical protein